MSKTSHPVAVVTGGSSGVGLATAIRLAGKGYRIAICGRRESLLTEALEKMQSAAGDVPADHFVAKVADLSDSTQAKKFAEEVLSSFGNIDVLVNNAGMAPLGPLEELTDETFETTLSLNVRCVFYLTRAFWSAMKGQGSGTVVNISSLAAIDPFPGFSIYGASKAWVDLFTKALAGEGGESGVRVCSVRPGAVETPLLRSLFPDFPAEQCVSPDEVAAVILGCIEQPEKYVSGGAYEVTNQPR